jgi:O-antigen ligase
LLRQQNAGDALGRFEPHNDYLNIWLSFGTLALATYLLMMWCTLSNFRDAFNQLSDPLLRGIALGSLGALIAFGINSFFHNFFDSVLTLWILAGLSVALMTLAAKETAPQAEGAW